MQAAKKNILSNNNKYGSSREVKGDDGRMTISIIIAVWLYLWAGLFARYRKTIYRPRCPRGAEAVISTVLFWPWKISAVFCKKWRAK